MDTGIALYLMVMVYIHFHATFPLEILEATLFGVVAIGPECELMCIDNTWL